MHHHFAVISFGAVKLFANPQQIVRTLAIKSDACVNEK